MHNIFTYPHSELPTVPPEIQADIVALDVQIADLILRIQGNYCALEQLTEILDNCLDSCELNLRSIRIIPDNSSQLAISMTDLPIDQKQIIFSTAIMFSVAIEALVSICNKTAQQVTTELVEKARELTGDFTTDLIDSVIDELIETWKAKPNQAVYRIELDSD